jgi:hypothetical protein
MPRRSFFSGLPPLQRSVVLLGVLVSTSITYVACGGSDRTFGANGQNQEGTGGDTETGGRTNGGSGNSGGRQGGSGGTQSGGRGNGGGGGATGASGTGASPTEAGVGGGRQDASKDAAEDSPSSNAD